MLAKRALAAAMGLMLATVALPAPEGPTEELRLLRQQWALFQSFPPERQEAVRKFDKAFNELPPVDRDRLRRVMERYAGWLEQLPEKSRKRIEGRTEPEHRLAAIGEQKLVEWIETLPRARREEYEKAKLGEKPHLIEKWKAEEEDRREQWKFAVAHWNEKDLPAMMESLDANKANWTLYLENLGPQLAEPQKLRLRDLMAGLRQGDDAKKSDFLSFVGGIANKKPLLPGPSKGPKHLEELPKSVQTVIDEHNKRFGTGRKLWNKDVFPTIGKWPDYAQAVSKYFADLKIPIPEPLVKATRKGEMPPEIVKFLDEEVEGKLKGTEAGRSATEQLKAAEGKWPDYPKAIMKIARDNNLFVPGWMPPNWKKKP